MFLIILKGFFSFSTMQLCVQACICWSKYATLDNLCIMFKPNLMTFAILVMLENLSDQFCYLKQPSKMSYAYTIANKRWHSSLMLFKTNVTNVKSTWEHSQMTQRKYIV